MHDMPNARRLRGRDSVCCVVDADARREQKYLFGAGECWRQAFGFAEVAYCALGACRQTSRPDWVAHKNPKIQTLRGKRADDFSTDISGGASNQYHHDSRKSFAA